ncbi:MAG: MFS transporter [Clostridia bacterium]
MTVLPKQKVGAKNWFLIWALGLAGQLCWCVENTWFANYLYADFGFYVGIVTAMTIFSALATTFATFLFGTLADRLGTRKPFIAFGYIAWGIFTIVYGLTHLYRGAISDNIAVIAIIIVATDTIMSFFGSAGNDSGFNAWCSDMLDDSNRGQIGMALAAQPVIGTLVGTLIGGVIIDYFGASDRGAGYMAFFIIMGVFVIIFGLIALFAVKDSPTLKPYKNGSFWKQFISVFNFKEFFKRKELVWVNLTVTVFFIGFNCYFVHIMNWLCYTLNFGAGNGGLLLGIPLVLSVLITIPFIFLINHNKSPLIAIGSIIITVIGCIVIFFGVGEGNSLATVPSGETYRAWLSLDNLPLYLGILCVGIGYVASIQTYMVWMKKLYPEEQKGQFEGIRILFFVLFPMVAGPLIANPIIKATGEVTDMIIEGIKVEGQYLPTKWLFLASLIITILAIVPLIFAIKHHNLRIKAEKQDLQEIENLPNS